MEEAVLECILRYRLRAASDSTKGRVKTIMWLLVVSAIVLFLVIALIGEALGYDMTTKPGASMQEYKRERDELVNRGFSGNRLPDDEEQMFETFYEGDVNDSEWN